MRGNHQYLWLSGVSWSIAGPRGNWNKCYGRPLIYNIISCFIATARMSLQPNKVSITTTFKVLAYVTFGGKPGFICELQGGFISLGPI